VEETTVKTRLRRQFRITAARRGLMAVWAHAHWDSTRGRYAVHCNRAPVLAFETQAQFDDGDDEPEDASWYTTIRPVVNGLYGLETLDRGPMPVDAYAVVPEDEEYDSDAKEDCERRALFQAVCRREKTGGQAGEDLANAIYSDMLNCCGAYTPPPREPSKWDKHLKPREVPPSAEAKLREQRKAAQTNPKALEPQTAGPSPVSS
jgi:hypothetical protein